MNIEDIISSASVIPVLEVERLEDAPPLAEALLQGGLRVVELTLRTSCALDAVGVMNRAASELIVGMGSILTPNAARQSINAGAAFLVSPGANASLLDAFATLGAPCLPGVATASESITALGAGFNAQKFFPAESAGGVAYLKALAGPLPGVMFCPTGGVSPDKAPAYLNLPNVACVGGSWIATKKLISEGNWLKIEQNAKRAAKMASHRKL